MELMVWKQFVQGCIVDFHASVHVYILGVFGPNGVVRFCMPNSATTTGTWTVEAPSDLVRQKSDFLRVLPRPMPHLRVPRGDPLFDLGGYSGYIV